MDPPKRSDSFWIKRAQKPGWVETLIKNFDYIEDSVWQEFLQKKFPSEVPSIYKEPIEKGTVSILAPHSITDEEIEELRDASSALLEKEKRERRARLLADPRAIYFGRP
ncbi:hypothetical protein ABW19_dt0207635 [Dactylella cylindrospora]|nr:hypothetical protein ABW19_dt0207635 [Dactylella cylindrospora]